MMNSEPDECRHESRENIPWFLNGTLSGTAADAVREHIDGCSDCQADFELHTDMRATVLANGLTPMIPATKAEDIIGVGRNGRTHRSSNGRSRSQLMGIAAGIAILGVALVMSFYANRGVEETNQSFETATSAGSPGGIAYVLQLRFEEGISTLERGRIAAQLEGVASWSINENGNYEVHVQLGEPSLGGLQEYEERAVALPGVHSAKFTALQLPMR